MKLKLRTALLSVALLSNIASATTEAEQSCFQSYKNVIAEGDMTTGEVAQNASVIVGAVSSSSVASTASASVKSVVKLVLVGGAVGAVLLTANEQFQIIDRIFAQAVVGTGELLSDISDAAKDAGVKYKPSEIAESVRKLDIENDFFAKYMCTEENRPVILGRYIQMVFDNLNKSSK